MKKLFLSFIGVPVGSIQPQNLEETLIWYTITGTWWLYILGAPSIWVPGLVWFLAIRLLFKWWSQDEQTPEAERVTIPLTIWIWIAGMVIVWFALLMGHLEWDLGTYKILTGTFVWTRSFAMMALLPLVGCLKIRPVIIYRSLCILCLQTLPVLLFCLAFYLRGKYLSSFVAPLGYLLAPGPNKEAYTVQLFYRDWTSDGQFRLNLFTPVANALGLTSALYFFLVSQEPNKLLRFISMGTAAAMVVGSGSRMPSFCIMLVPILTFYLSFITRPYVLIFSGIGSCIAGMYAPALIDWLQTFWDQKINSFRASSAVVRSRVRDFALQLWEDSPLWGYGVVEPKGPQYTDNIPVGTHHQWAGLLYRHGLIGCVAFLIPFVWSFLDLLIRAQRSAIARVALCIYVTLAISTFAAELEGASVLFAPAMIFTGMAFNEKLRPVSAADPEPTPGLPPREMAQG